MSDSLALSVDELALNAAETSGFLDPVTFDFAPRPVCFHLGSTNTIEDLQPLLALLHPEQAVDDTFLIEATAISGDGRIVCGRMNFPASTSGDPFATLDEGWIARMS